MSSALLGREHGDVDRLKKWELLYEDMWLMILDTGVRNGSDTNLVGISTTDGRVKWAVGGAVSDPATYDGVVSVYVKDGQVHAGTWSGWDYTLDHRTGAILAREFRK